MSNANLIDLTHGAGVGSFELGNYIDGSGLPGGFPGYMGVGPGDSSTITGWTVGGSGDGVDWLIKPSFNADTGVHSVDLQHSTESSISTVIPTLIGNFYELSFTAAAYVGSGNTGVVSAGSLINQAFTTSFSSDGPTQVFHPFNFLFTATELTTTIRFTSTSTTSAHYGPAIDTVSAVSTAAAPEPGTVILLSAGLLGMLGSGLRRRNIHSRLIIDNSTCDKAS